MSIPRDVQLFLDRYPSSQDDADVSANLKFYANQLRCRPDDKLIEEIHDQWFGDFSKLEHKHGFIQWLFPIREYGMNYESQPLQAHEIETMKSDPLIISRVVQSYRLMLDFCGMRLVSEKTGLLDRVLPPRNYGGRYHNLVHSSHNYLRISRILKCLSEFGLEHLNAGFLLHVLSEQSESNELNSPGLRSSMDRWWANCIRNKGERQWVGEMIRKVRSNDGFIFTRALYEKALANRAAAGSLDVEGVTNP
ncbi:opioid growth factor receptor conserved region-domain-containing protein [Crucibulum laeve]|uniref:Opioid growth factor receptor conserved region-domain-containing protein n=1 Tax=Crucibulum laeve TaxID=68775 RepID=A0A5C3M5E0_9AGAR|nr:opioid growth factor receptor conserved region-domain-containing protein [Crucibulum laeve]